MRTSGSAIVHPSLNDTYPNPNTIDAALHANEPDALFANRGHDTRALQAYLGHKNIHTVRYTRAVTDEIQELLAGVSVSRSCVARYS
jgi:hypothetical protein